MAETPKPTPTQEENDLAKMGAHVVEKEWDGSPIDPTSPDPTPPEGGTDGGNGGNGGNGGGSTALTITGLSPSTAPLPSAALTINGTNFNSDCKVLFEGVLQADGAMVSDTQMTVTVGAPAAGSYSVRVDDTAALKSSNVVMFDFTDTARRGPQARR
jgi:IPT/TIG domain